MESRAGCSKFTASKVWSDLPPSERDHALSKKVFQLGTYSLGNLGLTTDSIVYMHNVNSCIAICYFMFTIWEFAANGHRKSGRRVLVVVFEHGRRNGTLSNIPPFCWVADHFIISYHHFHNHSFFVSIIFYLLLLLSDAKLSK